MCLQFERYSYKVVYGSDNKREDGDALFRSAVEYAITDESTEKLPFAVS